MSEVLHKNEVLGLERRYWEAMKNRDVETAVSLTKFPCTLTSPQGVRKVTEAQYRETMQSMQGDHFENVQIRSPHVDLLSPDVAMISYSTEINGMKMVDVSTWVRDGERWACAFHSENPVQEKNAESRAS